MRRRTLTQNDLQRMLIPERFWGVRFEDISDEEPEGGGQSLRGAVIAYGQKLEQMMTDGIGLCLWGDNGVGKTCAAVAMMKEARRRGYTGLFLPAADIRTVVIDKVQFDDEETLWDRARGVDFLLIDDIGKGTEDKTGFLERTIDQLVRHRSAHHKATWMTTNMTRTDMKAWFKHSTLAAMQEVVVPVKAHGPNRRLEAQKELSTLFER